MWQIILAVGLVVGLGLALLVAELAPREPKLAAALDRLGSAEVSTTAEASSLEGRLGGWGQRHLADLPLFTVPTRDLLLLGRSTQTYFANKITLGVLGLVAPSVVALLFWALGFSPFIVGIAGIAAVPLALVMLVLGDVMVKQQADEARQEFSRAIAAYLELVAAERKRGASPSVALEEAAGVGESWVFERIRQELMRARFSGVQPWDSLRDLSNEIGVKELADVADIMRLSGEEGAAVYESLRARGRALRVQLLNEEHTVANRLSERMTYPQALLGVIFMAMLVTPPLLRLVAS
ncbi:TadC protein [Clavibacter michiganensis]|uniref:TadC protein n=1 Tax=Clavibacter michiganensis TaxID=28447 RepID=UPI002931B0E0|nr:TadC protein [Clavibacter michiganensis]